MIALTLEDLSDQHLKLLLEGEDLEKLKDLIGFDKIWSGIMTTLLRENLSLTSQPANSDLEYWKNWLDKLDKKEQLVAHLIWGWSSQIIPSTVRIYQVGNLLTDPISPKERSKRCIYTDTAWYELMIPIYLNEIYTFRERIKYWLKRIERELKRFGGTPASIQENIKQHLQSCDIEKLIKGVTKTRGKHVHQFNYSDPHLQMLYPFEAMSGYEKGFKGVLSEQLRLSSTFKRLNQDYLKKWTEITKSHKFAFLEILNSLSIIFRDAMYYVCPRFEDIKKA